MTRTFFLLFALTACASTGLTQTDSVEIFGGKRLVQGIYKNYQEYVNNAPSVKATFTLIPFAWSLPDSLAIGVEYALAKDSKIYDSDIWGFCDGRSVFVKYNYVPPLSFHVGKSTFWKLDCIGPFSYFTYVEPDPWASSFGKHKPKKVKPRDQWMYLVDNKGKVKEPRISLMKEYLTFRPELLKSFSEEADIYEPYDYNNAPELESTEMRLEKYAVIKSYLIKLNRALTDGNHN